MNLGPKYLVMTLFAVIEMGLGSHVMVETEPWQYHFLVFSILLNQSSSSVKKEVCSSQYLNDNAQKAILYLPLTQKMPSEAGLFYYTINMLPPSSSYNHLFLDLFFLKEKLYHNPIFCE